MGDVPETTSNREIEAELGRELKQLGEALEAATRAQRSVADLIAEFAVRLRKFREGCTPIIGALFQDREEDMHRVAEKLRKQAELNLSLAGEFMEIGLQKHGPGSAFYPTAQRKHPLGLQLTWIK
jgi:hypothetical protein